MSDTLITIFGVFLAAILMFIFPLMEVANQNDAITQTTVSSLVSDFANQIANQGKLTQNDYDTFISKLYSTGNTYDVELEFQILDDNPGSKTTTTSQDMIGENIYYSVYTSSIEGIINNKGVYQLKQGDYVVITATNNNVTLGTQLKNFFYKIVGKDTYTVAAKSSALVINTGNKN